MPQDVAFDLPFPLRVRQEPRRAGDRAEAGATAARGLAGF
jgi:hypothetical protein